MAILRDLPPERLSDHQLTFQDKRIAPLLFHYRARHFYKTLTRTRSLAAMAKDTAGESWKKVRYNLSKICKN